MAEGDSPLRVGVLCGSDVIASMQRDQEDAVAIKGNNDSWRFVHDRPDIEWHRMHLAKNYFRQRHRWTFDNLDVVYNVITDLDQNPKVMGIAEKLDKTSKTPMAGHPTPLRATTREQLCRKLSGLDGVWMPETRRVPKATQERVRNAADKMDPPYPFLLRHAGTHTGLFLGLIRSEADLAAIELDGKTDCFVTQFVDFKSEDGLYRKYRFFAMGDAILPRHALVGHEWNIHAKMRQEVMLGNAQLCAAEQKFVEEPESFPPGLEPVRSIIRRLGCDYLGIDCAVAPDGRMLIFEANATMNFFPFSDDSTFDYMLPLIERGQTAMSEMLHTRSRRN